MSYPFGKAPTVCEFVDRLVAEFNCQLHDLDGATLQGPRGEVKIQYVTRTYNGSDLVSEPLPESLEDRVSPDTARRLIVQLRLPKEAWMWAGVPSELDD